MENSKGRALRRSHVKSKTGCLTCRHKHIRCDELRPQCRNCLKRGYICDFTTTSNPVTAGHDPTSHITTTITSIPTAAATSAPIFTTTTNTKDEDISISTLWHEISNLQLPDREYFPPLPAKESSHHNPHPHQQQPHSRNGQDLPSSSQLRLNYKQLRSTTEPIENLRMMHHAAQITEGLALSGGHRLAMGTCNLPVFIDLARNHVFVKNSLLGLATAHLNCIVKLTALEALGSRYRREACRDLQMELGRFSKGNADAVLAASIMLGWQALDRAAYVKFMQGTAQVLKLMPSFSATSQLSELFSPLTPLSSFREAQICEQFRALSSDSVLSHTPASTYIPSHFPALLTRTPTLTPTLTMAPLLHALQTLYAILPSTAATSKAELRTTTLVLQNLLQNFRLLCSTSAKQSMSAITKSAARSSKNSVLHGHAVTASPTAPSTAAQPVSFATQFELFYPVRTWLPLMPVSILGVGRRDPWALLVMAYFHVVVVFVVGQLVGDSSGNNSIHSMIGSLGLSEDFSAGDSGGAKREGCGGALFAGRRTEIIVRIDRELEVLKKIADKEAALEAETEVEAVRERKAHEAWDDNIKQMRASERARELVRIEEFMRVPLMYVVDYRSKDFTF